MEKESAMRFFAAAILVLVLGGLVAAGAYEAGLQSAVQVVVPAAGSAPAVAPVAYYGHPYGWGYGFNPFGFLFPILGIFLFFALMRAVIGGGRGWGHYRGWYSDDHGVPGRFDEWHKRAHEGGPAAPPRQ
jgi:hypothetical protein